MQAERRRQVVAAGDVVSLMAETQALRQLLPASPGTVKLVLISGPSKAGKKTMANGIREHDPDRWICVDTSCGSEELVGQLQAIAAHLSSGASVIAVGRNMGAARREHIFAAANCVAGKVAKFSVCVSPRKIEFRLRNASRGWEEDFMQSRDERQAPDVVDRKGHLAITMRCIYPGQVTAVGLLINGDGLAAVSWLCAPHRKTEKESTGTHVKGLGKVLCGQLPEWMEAAEDACAAAAIRAAMLVVLHVEHTVKRLGTFSGGACLC